MHDELPGNQDRIFERLITSLSRRLAEQKIEDVSMYQVNFRHQIVGWFGTPVMFAISVGLLFLGIKPGDNSNRLALLTGGGIATVLTAEANPHRRRYDRILRADDEVVKAVGELQTCSGKSRNELANEATVFVFSMPETPQVSTEEVVVEVYKTFGVDPPELM